MEIILLVLLEIIPVTMWVVGLSCTKNKTKYPNTSLGYKTPISVKSRNAWDYANEFAGKLANILGGVLFVVNAVVVMVTGVIWPMFLVNIFGYVLLHIAVTKAVSKRFTEEGKIKKGI